MTGLTDSQEKAMKRIRQARFNLLNSHPFFGDLAFGMPIKINDELNPPTAATDGENLYYHSEFVNSLSLDELMFVTGHEILHAALTHVFRRGTRDPINWNIACDVVVNQILINNRVGKMPKGLIYNPILFQECGGLVDRVYDKLPKNPNTSPMDHMIDNPGIDKAASAAKWRGRMEQAMDAAKKAGKMPGEIETLLAPIESQTVAWEDELFTTVTTEKGEDRTYAKRNRRYAALDVLLPGKYGEKTDDIVFAIDCSGSTSDAMVARCANEVQRIMRTLRPEKLHVLYFDTAIKKHEVYGPDDELDVRAYGRGGTMFSPIFEYIAEKGIEPQHVIVATDLYCDDYGPEPSYPVIWCVMDSKLDNAPWGKVIVTE